MSTFATQYLLHEESQVEDGRVGRWRFHQFQSFGVDDKQGWLLAAFDADLHHTRSLAAAGRLLDLALKILFRAEAVPSRPAVVAGTP